MRAKPASDVGSAARQRHNTTEVPHRAHSCNGLLYGDFYRRCVTDSDAAVCGNRSALHKPCAASSAACLLKFCIMIIMPFALLNGVWCASRFVKHTECFLTHVLKGVFRALDIQPGCPSFSQFFSESVLYLRFSPQPKQAKLYYIGSAAKCTTACEHTRFRKYKQVVEEKLVSAELALRYWAEKRTFWHWRSVPF